MSAAILCRDLRKRYPARPAPVEAVRGLDLEVERGECFGLLRLEDAVRRMTSLNARKLGLHDRGVLRPGAAADVTVFDPERIIDRSTYTEPFRYSEGIEYVIVNGQLVLDRGKHTGARPGQALRRTR